MNEESVTLNRGNPQRVDVLVVNDEADTPSLLNPMTGQIFVTNAVGKRVIELADGAIDVERIVEEITREFKGVSRAVAREEITRFLEETTEKGLVTWIEV